MQDDRKVDALLRFHFKVNPRKLEEKARLKLWYDLLYAREEERKFQLSILRQILNEAFPKKSSS